MGGTASLNRKYSIVQFGHKSMPSREGGIEVVVEELSTRMARLGHEVTCINRRGRHANETGLESQMPNDYKGIKIVTVPTINRKGLAAVSASFFASIKAAFGHYDIVHVHAEGPALFCWIPKAVGKRVVCTVHGLDYARAKWGRFGRLCILGGERSAVRHADEIIVLSRNVQDYFRETYGRRTVFIPNGVERPEAVEAKEITEKWGLRKDDYLLFLGRLVPEKGVHYLIEAYLNIKDRTPERLKGKKLVIAGGSSDTDAYVDGLKAMGEDIIFTGFQQGKVREELYSNAYVYVLPSDLEGMPLSLLEAMSYGNCCLVSSIKECTEVVEDKAAVFGKGNVHDLERELQRLCGDKQLVDSYKDSAADFICSKYRWNDVVERTLEVYGGKVGNEGLESE